MKYGVESSSEALERLESINYAGMGVVYPFCLHLDKAVLPRRELGNPCAWAWTEAARLVRRSATRLPRCSQ